MAHDFSNRSSPVSGLLCRLLIILQDVEHLTSLANDAVVSIELKRYQQDIISFLRVHRAVAGGVSAASSKHLDQLSKYAYPFLRRPRD